MISVVMASFNGEKYIKEQLESIVTQTRKPDEIIINDDCSVDNTEMIVLGVRQNSEIPISFQKNKERLGYAENFRQAIRRAQGDIIFLCDQDDIWIKDKVEICMSAFEKKEVLALSTGFYLGNDLKTCIDSRKNIKPVRMIPVTWKAFIRHPKYPGMAMAFRKSIWPDIDAMNWKKAVAHDWMINQYAAAHNGMYRIPNKLVFYRQHDSNAEGVIVNNSKADIREKRMKLIDELLAELDSIVPEESWQLDFQKKMHTFQKKRRSLLAQAKTWSLFFYELRRIECITVRSVLGDLYVGLTSKEGKE